MRGMQSVSVIRLGASKSPPIKVPGNHPPRVSPILTSLSVAESIGGALRIKTIALARRLCLSILVLSYAVAGENLSDGGFYWWQALDLRDLDGAEVPLAGRWVVLGFLDTDCPVANAYLPVLNSLSQSFQDKGVRVIGVYADHTLKTERLREHAREFSIGFPVLQDRDHHLVRLSRVTYSSEVAVLDGSGSVLYHGRIDDRVGENGATRPKATQHDLKTVLNRLCAGEVGPFPTRQGFGCVLPNPVSQP
jgi:peroxiredoxin